jgi:shikimate kinase
MIFICSLQVWMLQDLMHFHNHNNLTTINQQSKIYLLGYMAVGKTTLGKQLAEALHYDFIDLDEWIEYETKKTIAQFFEEEGEVAFRKIEQEYLHKTFVLTNTLISCGGGTPCFYDNMEQMNAHGKTVWVEADVKDIAKRIQAQKNKRPLLNTLDSIMLEQKIETHLNERISYYNQAKFRFQSKNADILNFLAILSR